MRRYDVTKYAMALMITVLLSAGFSCATADEGKIPITTSSDEALKQYLEGRDLTEKLRGQESIQRFQAAIDADPNFALAHLQLSFVQPSAKGFFESLDRAKALVDKVSEGERLWILGTEAGVNGEQMKQRELFKKLVAAYPNDERAHNILGGHYFGQQEYEQAIASYERAIAIAPDFSPPYNQLGYAYRFLERYPEAEKTFKKYTEVTPDDPNPYDSYAELLMKIGKYDESIENYKKALSKNPDFVFSHIGIATNLNFMGRHQEAREQLNQMYVNAKNDGQRRAAHFATAVSYVDEGKVGKALEELDKQYALAEKIDDAAAMAGDLIVMGNILLEAGKPEHAMSKYEMSLKTMEESDLSEEVKDGARRGFLYNSARAALARKDFATAKANAAEYRKRVEAIQNPFQIKLSHGLAGMIALEEKQFDRALEELGQANQQNSYNIYRMMMAYEGKGDKETAKELCMKAAKFNPLNSMNHAFIRNKAEQMLASM